MEKTVIILATRVKGRNRSFMFTFHTTPVLFTSIKLEVSNPFIIGMTGCNIWTIMDHRGIPHSGQIPYVIQQR